MTEQRECDGTSAFDGVYGITFQRDGQPSALGTFEVGDAAFQGRVEVADDTHVDFTGCVRPDGTLSFTQLSASSGVDVSVEGRIDRGVASGGYTLDGATGSFAGSKGNRAHDESHGAFDGTYRIRLSRGGEVRATFDVTVENSGYTVEFSTLDGESIEVQGFVTSDGTLVLNTVNGDIDRVMAEAAIDHDTFEITGLYLIAGQTGNVSGERLQ